MPETIPTPSRTFWSLGVVPAQSWIAEARRSRDLLTGSTLLSWSMGRLLSFLENRPLEVLLPKLAEQDFKGLSGTFRAALEAGSTGVSNHASGWIAEPLEQAETLFRELEGCLAEAWSEFHKEVAGDAAHRSDDLWQLTSPEIGKPPCPLQVVWALKETSGVPDKDGLHQVEALYSAVKRSRLIPSHLGGAEVRKCGQCGKRESLGGPDPARWRQFQDKLTQLKEVQEGLRFTAAEYLCTVCALRRLGGYLREESFPSTSTIAASDWVWNLKSSDDLRSALRSFQNAAQKVPGYEPKWVDRASLYYRHSVARELRAARQTSDSARAEALEAVLASQKNLASEIRRHNQKDAESPIAESPAQYLAVVMFDGDDMGSKLREDLGSLPGQVVQFQKNLNAYFGERDDETPPKGQPFYLGGDEGLILAPAGVALGLADEIRRKWQETAGSTEGKATLSMGIAFFDHERPLGAAIETAKRSLKRAKQMLKKNALAISVQTASGSEWMAVARWGESWERVSAAVELIRRGTLSSGWPHDVERFLRTLPKSAFRGDSESRSAIREEVRRLTWRRSKPASKQTVWENLHGDTWWSEQPADEELSTLADHFHLVAFLARQSTSIEAGS